MPPGRGGNNHSNQQQHDWELWCQHGKLCYLDYDMAVKYSHGANKEGDVVHLQRGYHECSNSTFPNATVGYNFNANKDCYTDSSSISNLNLTPPGGGRGGRGGGGRGGGGKGGGGKGGGGHHNHNSGGRGHSGTSKHPNPKH